GDADAAARALGGSADKYRSLGEAAGGAAGQVDEGSAAIRASGAAADSVLPALRDYDAVLRSIAAGGAPGGAGGGAPPGLGNPAREALTPLLAGRRFAAGGFVTGPGGPRDDQVPILASNGEFIINADAAG